MDQKKNVWTFGLKFGPFKSSLKKVNQRNAILHLRNDKQNRTEVYFVAHNKRHKKYS